MGERQAKMLQAFHSLIYMEQKSETHEVEIVIELELLLTAVSHLAQVASCCWLKQKTILRVHVASAHDPVALVQLRLWLMLKPTNFNHAMRTAMSTVRCRE